MLPFSQEELDYIARLDAEADCRLLQRELPWLREAALRTLVISTCVLQVRGSPPLAGPRYLLVLSLSLGRCRPGVPRPVQCRHVPRCQATMLCDGAC